MISMLKNYRKIKQIILGKRYTLFVADTARKKKLGLKMIKKMEKQTGMLFPYNKEEPGRIFTMKNVYFDLRFIFLDKNMNVIYQQVGISNGRNVVCEKPSMYVIEIPA